MTGSITKYEFQLRQSPPGFRNLPVMPSSSDLHLSPPVTHLLLVCYPLSSDNSYFLLHQNSKTTRFTLFILVLCPLELYPYIHSLPSVSQKRITLSRLHDLISPTSFETLVQLPLTLTNSDCFLPQQTSSASSHPSVEGQPWLIHSTY